MAARFMTGNYSYSMTGIQEQLKVISEKEEER